MALKFISENLGALPATDVLGNTGWLEKPTQDPVRALTFFNNSAHNQYLLVDVPQSIPVKIPASTSLSLQFADLLAEDVHKITVFGTTGDLVTIVYTTGSIAQLQQLLSGGGPIMQRSGGRLMKMGVISG